MGTTVIGGMLAASAIGIFFDPGNFLRRREAVRRDKHADSDCCRQPWRRETEHEILHLIAVSLLLLSRLRRRPEL